MAPDAPNAVASAAAAASTTTSDTVPLTLMCAASSFGSADSVAAGPGTQSAYDRTVAQPAVAIVGAGITVLAIALHLAEKGIGPVRVYERTCVAVSSSNNLDIACGSR